LAGWIEVFGSNLPLTTQFWDGKEPKGMMIPHSFEVFKGRKTHIPLIYDCTILDQNQRRTDQTGVNDFQFRVDVLVCKIDID
jgi:hypothetical protein